MIESYPEGLFLGIYHRNSPEIGIKMNDRKVLPTVRKSLVFLSFDWMFKKSQLGLSLLNG